MKIIAIVPVRAGSKRVPHKNVKPFVNKSLTILACEQVMRLHKYFSDICITTDSDAAIQQAGSCGIPIIRRRPDHLATDNASSESAIEDVLNYMKETKGAIYTHILLLEPTSPLRFDSDITKSLDLAEIYGRGVKSVTTVKNCLSEEIVEPKQQLNGAIHIWDANWIRDMPYTRFSFYEMPPERSIHIDYPWEFDCAELLYIKYHGTN